LDESDLFQYFGEPRLETGYLFIYNSVDYSSEDLIRSMMPDGWQPPAPMVVSPTRPDITIVPPILATTELDDDEEPDLKTPTMGNLTTPTSNSPRLKPRVDKVAHVPVLKPPTLDTKRPSLPTIQVNSHGPVTPGPMTSITGDPEKEGSSWNWFSSKSKTKK
jgi:hypothetical protein